MDGSENFTRGWSDYVSGFGKICREYWLGLDKIHCLTTSTARTELRIDMADFRGEKKYAYYNFFMVGNADSNYKLQVAGYSGTAGDSLRVGKGDKNVDLNGMPFSTHDIDNGQCSDDCAQLWKGGWWYKCCTYSQLNGIYHYVTSPEFSYESVYWASFDKSRLDFTLKFAEMKLRARD